MGLKGCRGARSCAHGGLRALGITLVRVVLDVGIRYSKSEVIQLTQGS